MATLLGSEKAPDKEIKKRRDQKRPAMNTDKLESIRWQTYGSLVSSSAGPYLRDEVRVRRDDVQRLPRPKVPDATRVVLSRGGQVVPVWREVDPQNLQATLAALLNNYRPSIQPSRQPARETFHQMHMLVSSSSMHLPPCSASAPNASGS
jgi:hypothetical protein